MTDRLALLPLTGAGERTCDGCGACLPVDTSTGAVCGALGDGIRAAELRLSRSKREHVRLPQCLAAERAAKRLLRVEEAAIDYAAADDAAGNAIREDALCYGSETEDAIEAASKAWEALRAALKE